MKIAKLPVVLCAMTLLTATACDNFLDVNTDPIDPIDVPITLLLPTSQTAMSNFLGHSVQGLSQPTAAIMQQLVNFRIGAFTLDGNSFNNQWQGLYTSMLENNEQVIERGTASSAWTFVGIAQIQKAYVFSQMVDMWGDIPYSEALKGVQNVAPRFDDDEAIYTDLFRLIDEGIANLRRTDSSRNPGGEDLIYSGDKAKWIRLANTLKLKLYNQVRLTRNVTTEITPLLSAPADLITAADDFEFRYGLSAGTPENRNPGFQGDYTAAGRENNINPYFFGLMRGASDPRVPYYFFNQYNSTAPLATADFQDGRFISVRFGSTGQQANANTVSTRTLQGLYPIGGAFDSGTGGNATGAFAKGNVPQRLLTFYARHFIEAELQLMVLNNPVAARSALREAVNASFAKVNSIAAAEATQSRGATTVTIPPIAPAAIATYLDAVLARYDATSSSNDRLNIIMTEKYVASFGFGADVYTDYRRTGFPNVPFADTDPDPQTVSTGSFPVRLPYRLNDLLTNPNAPQVQPNITTEKVFWDR